MKNHVSYTDLRSMSPSEIVSLNIEELAYIHQEIKETEDAIKGAKQLFNSAIVEKYAGSLTVGTGNYKDEGYKIKVVKPLRPSWDNDKLAEVEKIIASGWKKDPSEYIETKRSVKEAAYKNWPADLRAMFEPARTEKTGAPTVTIEKE